MKFFDWFKRERVPKDVYPNGRDEYIVKLPNGEVSIGAEIFGHSSRFWSGSYRAIAGSSVRWSQPSNRTLTEEEKQLAIEKLCDFFRRRKTEFVIDYQGQPANDLAQSVKAFRRKETS